MQLQSFFRELKRRNVFRIATAYAIAGWVIIQISDTVFPAFDFPDWTTQFVIIMVGIGFPLSLIFAWAFELTPEGIKKSKEVDITASVTSRTGKKLNGVIIAVLSVAVFFLIIERLFFAKSSILEDANLSASIENASIAVLPFADLSPDGDQEYFSDGLSEELLNVLAKVENLKVAGRTSSFKFKGQNEDLKLIGEQLGVNHILEGSVRKSGDQIRITAQLISVNDGFHLWSETYDRTYNASNLFQIQDEISNQVLEELKLKLLGNDQEEVIAVTIPTEDVEAYEALLKGNELMRNRKPEEIRLAIEEYERAVKIDPSFGQAYANIAFAYARLYEYGSIDKDEVADLIRGNADRALFIDPTIARAYAGLSAYYKLKEEDENTLSAIKRAYELNPNDPELINSYAVQIGLDNQQKKADSLYFVAYELDPLSPVITYNTSNAYYRLKEYEKSLELLDKNIKLNPDFTPSLSRKITLLRNEPQGKLDEAFIAAYQGYQERKEDLYFIDLMITSAFQFDLDSLASIYEKEIIRLFPNNPAAEDIRINKKFQKMNDFMDNKEFEKARAYAMEYLVEEVGENREQFEEYLENAESSTLFSDYFENSEFQKAFEIIQEVYPEYLSDTLTTHPEYNMETYRIKYLFRQVGRDDLAQNLDKLEFEFGDWVEFNYDNDITLEAPNVVYQLAMESLYNNDIVRYTQIVEELYFNRKHKFHRWNTYFDQPHEIDLLEENPKLRELIDRVEADQKRMKDNVVTFLKEEGVWKDSWEAEEN